MASFLSSFAKDPEGTYALRNARTGGLIVSRLIPAFESKTRNRGLLGRESLDPREALVLAPCSSIHMFFMRFAIDVLFVNRDGVVRRTTFGIRPWRLAFSPGAFAAIETAAGVARESGTVAGDRLVIEQVTAPV